MNKDTIYFGALDRGVKETELCKLIINHVSKSNETYFANMVRFHMEEVKNISRAIIGVLGGTVVDARAINMCFYESLSKLGYTTSELVTPAYAVNDVSKRFGM